MFLLLWSQPPRFVATADKVMRREKVNVYIPGKPDATFEELLAYWWMEMQDDE